MIDAAKCVLIAPLAEENRVFTSAERLQLFPSWLEATLETRTRFAAASTIRAILRVRICDSLLRGVVGPAPPRAHFMTNEGKS
jgi:predicted secreted protein